MNFQFKSAVALAALFISGQASAASVSYYLDQSNDLPDDVNYAQVTISDGAAGDIDFRVEVLSGAFPMPLGDNFGMQTFSFNYDSALVVSASNIEDIDPGSWAIDNNKNAGGGFGKFDFQTTGDGGSRTLVLTFSIAGVVGDTVNSYALGNSSDGEFFAAHIADYDDWATDNTSGQFAGSTPVPVPAAVWLFGSALGMLGWMRRRSGAVS